jgi:hypothetical protein
MIAAQRHRPCAPAVESLRLTEANKRLQVDNHTLATNVINDALSRRTELTASRAGLRP